MAEERRESNEMLNFNLWRFNYSNYLNANGFISQRIIILSLYFT